MVQPVVSDAALEMYDAIKQWHPDDSAYGWPGLLWCEAICAHGLQTVLSLTRDSTDGPGWSSIMDLARCPTPDLPFLAQFRGIVIPPGTPADQARALILTQPLAARGRPATILTAVQGTLTGSKFVTLLERDTSAWHATIQTFAAETPDQAKTRAVIAANKPAMDIITLQVLTGPTYAQVRTSLPSDSYAARKTKFPTYEDVQEYVP